ASLTPDFEVQVRPLIARRAPNVSDDLTAGDPLALGDDGVAEVAVERVVAPAVVQQDGREVGAERAGEADAARGHRAHGRAGRRRDPDAVPRNAGLVGAGRRAELVEDLAVHRPVELAQVGGRDRGGRGRGPPGLRLAARPLERGDAVVEAALVPLERREPLFRLARAAPRLDERGLPRVLQAHVALQLVAALGAAPPQRVARAEQQVYGDAVDLTREPVDLTVQLVDDAVGRFLLELDVGQLVGERVRLRAQPLELLLHLRALTPDVFQPSLVVAQLLVEGWGTLG